MKSQRHFFQNASGEKLGARLDFPDGGSSRACALFAHCFTCSKNLKAVGNISQALTEEGIAVLRFDFTGLGESEGDFADTNFSSNVADLISAADFLKSELDAPRILIGHSLGGAAVLQAAADIPSVLAVATIGAPAEPSHVTRLLESERATIEAEGEAEVNLAGRTFRIKKQFLDDLDRARMTERIRDLKRALMIFHSPVDDTVGIDNAGEIFQAARHPKSFVSLDAADHLLLDERDSRYVGSVISAWASKYIEHPAPREEEIPASEGWVTVQTGATGYRTDIRSDGHRLVADEPVGYGGTDTGPSPYDYLSVALGSCTSITLRMYADRKGWPLDRIRVRLRHQKIHAEDCSACETETGLVDRIEREIDLSGPLDDLQRRRLIEIADRCPVHRTLHSEVSVETHLKR